MVKLSPLEETRLLVKVSKFYYEEGLSQDEIIKRLNLSRSKVSRLLQQARDEGIVQISVVAPKHLCSDIEIKLEKRFGLRFDREGGFHGCGLLLFCCRFLILGCHHGALFFELSGHCTRNNQNVCCFLEQGCNGSPYWVLKL